MTRRAKVWTAVAAIFGLLNLGGAAYAVALGEGLHAAVHVALFVAGAGAAWWLSPRRHAHAMPRDLADRLSQLEQSVDSVAIEVERIGEGQRFMTRLFTENGTARAPGQAAAEPVQAGTPTTRRN